MTRRQLVFLVGGIAIGVAVTLLAYNLYNLDRLTP